MCSMAHPPRGSAFSESQLPPGTSPWSSQFKSPSSFHFKFSSRNQAPQAPNMSSHFSPHGAGAGTAQHPRDIQHLVHHPARHGHGGFENLNPKTWRAFSANERAGFSSTSTTNRQFPEGGGQSHSPNEPSYIDLSASPRSAFTATGRRLEHHRQS